MSTSVIDFHSHVLNRDVLALTMSHNVASGFGTFPPYAPGSRFANVQAKMIDVAAHIEDMDRLGIDQLLLCLVHGGRLTFECARDAHEPPHELSIGRRRLAATQEQRVLHPGPNVAAQGQPDGRHLKVRAANPDHLPHRAKRKTPDHPG